MSISAAKDRNMLKKDDLLEIKPKTEQHYEALKENMQVRSNEIYSILFSTNVCYISVGHQDWQHTMKTSAIIGYSEIYLVAWNCCHVHK